MSDIVCGIFEMCLDLSNIMTICSRHQSEAATKHHFTHTAQYEGRSWFISLYTPDEHKDNTEEHDESSKQFKDINNTVALSAREKCKDIESYL